MTSQKTRKLVESALMIALATILSFFKVDGFWAQGGSVTACSMLPIIFIAFRYGLVWGSFTGVAYGLLQLLLATNSLAGASIGALVGSVLLDYILAFGILGIAAIFKKTIKNETIALASGSAFVIFLRFIMHFLSGVLIFGSYAPEGQSAAVYSLIYNGSYMLPEMILTTLVAVILTRYFSLETMSSKKV
ncbi:MAG: thiT [Oscillospiraceae bacterium]|nr:thiT [Oscillospiraceae bacterium]